MPLDRPRANASADRPSHVVKILSVRPDVALVVRFLGPIRGMFTHFASGRTIPCPGVGDCPSAQHRSRIVWKGYAPAEQWDANERKWFAYVLEVTEHLEEQIRGRELRGETWLLTRPEVRGKSDPVSGAFCERVAPEKVSRTFDILPVLLRFYHCSTLKLDVPNPLPARVQLEPVAGDAPRIPSDILPVSEAEQTPEDRAKIREQLEKLRKRGFRPEASRNGHAENNAEH